jgi:hypothetical protein
MFISDEEANNRLISSESILRRVKGGGKDNGSHTPKKKDNGSHPPTTASPIKDPTDETPEGDTLRKMLGMDNQRNVRGKNTDLQERADLGLAAQLVGNRNAGLMLGRGPDTAHEFRHGYRDQGAMYGGAHATPKAATPDQELLNLISQQKKQVRDLAFDRLTTAVGLISPEKLEAVKDVSKLARVSRDLATVVDKTMPEQNNQGHTVHFHIWRPEMQSESAYEVINLNSPESQK